jgi:hypothetical protein
MAKFPGIKSKIDEISEICQNINMNGRNTSMKIQDPLEACIIKIVDSLENKHEPDKEAYDKVLEIAPNAEHILNEMVEQVRLFSIYDTEPTKINFNYHNYLTKIKELLS